MKAITCTQCGAIIENVSERSVIVDCEYCGARIMMDRGEPVLPPKPSNVETPNFELEVEPDPSNSFVTVAGGAVALIIFLVGIFAMFPKSHPDSTSSVSSVYNTSKPSAPNNGYTWAAPVKIEPPKPLPVVNYQPRVSWDGPNDMEYFDDPEVDVSSVSNLTSEEVKKTVFKNRVVKLKVVINTEGEIDKVETISGHPLLVNAATESAKRSIFSSRSKPTTRILTYTFRVLND
jgi:DNA-directed RNA polymerase subunit RPC12/RpoP